MDISSIIKKLENCPCGKKHTSDLKSIEIGHNITGETGKILRFYGFPDKILVVADKNTLSVSAGVIQSLEKSGYSYKCHIYDDMKTADIKDARFICGLLSDYNGVLSVGTGSLNDICRHAVFLAGKNPAGVYKKFAILATAPSMDGFASGTAPITENNFKETRQGVQPDVLIADTTVLASSPAELKSAGFGDMMAKYIALADWRISALLTGEYYCENIAQLTREALRKMVLIADKVTQKDESTAEAIMEALIFTGIAMKLADSVRPASGAEHMLSHFWEMKKLMRGQQSDFHGKKVSVASLYLCRLYHKLAEFDKIKASPEIINKSELENVYTNVLIDDIMERNTPAVTENINPKQLEDNWEEIRKIINEEIPHPETMLKIMKSAGSATNPKEISIDYDLALQGCFYHSYMRKRLTLSRLIPMICIDRQKLIKGIAEEWINS